MAAETDFIRTIVGYIYFSYKSNADIMTDLKTQPIIELIENYTINWRKNIKQWHTHKNAIPDSTSQKDESLLRDPTNTGMRP
jgi:hypothetical protein